MSSPQACQIVRKGQPLPTPIYPPLAKGAASGIVVSTAAKAVGGIDYFLKTGIWEHRRAITAGAIGFPIALEIFYGLVACNKYKVPLQNQCKKLTSPFTKRERETQKDFTERRTRNMMKIAGGVLALGITAIATFTLPACLSFSVATTGVCGTIDLIFNAETYLSKINVAKEQWKEHRADFFKKRDCESDEAFKSRCIKNITCAVVAAAVAVGLGVSTYMLVRPLITAASLGKLTPWNPTAFLPCQTPLVVSLEYAVLGLMHAYFAVGNAQDPEGEKRANFHAASFFAALAFPAVYYAIATAAAPMRIHHSFIGLAFQLLPFRALQILGTYITADSAINTIYPQRGLDFQNILLERLDVYVIGMTIACAMQFLVSSAIRAAKSAEEREERSSKNAPLPLPTSS